MISIEQNPDDSPMPFALKPLVDRDVEALGAGVGQSMLNVAGATNPTGSTWFE